MMNVIFVKLDRILKKNKKLGQRLLGFSFSYKIKLVHLKESKFNAYVLQLLLRLSSPYRINMNFCSY